MSNGLGLQAMMTVCLVSRVLDFSAQTRLKYFGLMVTADSGYTQTLVRAAV